MVFGVKVEIEGSKRYRAVGIVMYHSANYCDFMSVVTLYSMRSGLFFSNMDAYSPSYAVPTLSIYREEYDLVKMNMRRNSWLANSPMAQRSQVLVRLVQQVCRDHRDQVCVLHQSRPQRHLHSPGARRQ